MYTILLPTFQIPDKKMLQGQPFLKTFSPFASRVAGNQQQKIFF